MKEATMNDQSHQKQKQNKFKLPEPGDIRIS